MTAIFKPEGDAWTGDLIDSISLMVVVETQSLHFNTFPQV